MKLSDLAGAEIVTATPGVGLAGGGNEMLLKPATTPATDIAGVPPAVPFGKKKDKSEGIA
jgi:hypothetical protein